MNLDQLIATLKPESITEKRKKEFAPLIDYIKEKKQTNAPLQLNFICTHNSRRSQFSQLWAKVMAHHFDIECTNFSGGVEVTACNERVIKALTKQGFEITTSKQNEENPIYSIGNDGIVYGSFFSKLYNDENNPSKDFAAVMTCGHADENCPFIVGAEKRIPLRYTDPKRFDDLPNESEGYLNKSIEIATEMLYIFSNS